MKLLAWDTSSKAGAIVALEWPADSPSWESVRQAGEWSLNVDSQHSERLLWGIHQMLESARWKLEEIDAFAVGVGPGSFTGLRIGITTARTLAHALQKPLMGVSSLAALARPAALWLKSTERSDVMVVASTDACKGELFALWGKASAVAGCVQAPQEEQEGLWKRDVRELVIAPEELMDAVKSKLKKDSAWLAVGEGRSRYGDAWKKLPAKQELKLEVPFTDQVQGRYLGMLAWEAWQAKMSREALAVHPRYVRASDAEIKLKSGVLKKAPSEVPASLLVGEKA
ncbi:MAG: tRNA (adenosine(37)-N6)-threonylcarbamoyltransferase complex dimerization subunit type 1 TsaB [Bdellovibrionia bacterium]